MSVPKARRAAPPPGANEVKQDSSALARTQPPQPVITADFVDPSERSPDWRAASSEAVERYAAQVDEQTPFSATPPALRERCKPREFDEDTARIMREKEKMTAKELRRTGPDPVGPDLAANCIIVGGFPKCVQKIGRAADGRRLAPARARPADMQSAKRQDSSVPSPHGCD